MRVRRLNKQAEMALFANALKFPEHFLQLLRENPAFAKQLGRAAEHSRRVFAAAYPGQTRTRVVPNAEWAKAGHHHMAEFGQLLGLKGS